MDSLGGYGQIETRHSPLEGYARLFEQVGGKDSVRIRERPLLAMVDLRVSADEQAAFGRVEASLGLPMPGCGEASGDAGRAVLWLGPDWWLVVGPDGTAAETAVALEKALDGAHGSVVDVSAQRTAIDLTGPRSREVIMTGCPIDLHPREFPVGSCAQTLFARAPVILHHLPNQPSGSDSLRSPGMGESAAPAYRVFVRASYASYLAHWLLDAVESLGSEP